MYMQFLDVTGLNSLVNAVYRLRVFPRRCRDRMPSLRRHRVDPSPAAASLSRKMTNPSIVSMPAAECVTSVMCV